MSLRKEIQKCEAIMRDDRESPERRMTAEQNKQKYEHILDLWSEFGDVPMDPEKETLDEPWKQFPKGTHRYTIWHWFEEYFRCSVAIDLMYE